MASLEKSTLGWGQGAGPRQSAPFLCWPTRNSLPYLDSPRFSCLLPGLACQSRQSPCHQPSVPSPGTESLAGGGPQRKWPQRRV